MYLNTLGLTESVRVAERDHSVCRVAARCWSSPGCPRWWWGNPRCTSWQAERELCAGWTETWFPCFRGTAPLHHSKETHPGIKGGDKEGNSPRRISRAALHWRLRGFTGKKQRNPPPSTPLLLPGSTTALPSLFLPLPRLVFPPPSSSSAPSPGNVLTVGSCFRVSQSSGGIAQPLGSCATAAVRFPSCNAQAKGPQHRLPDANQ